jgi:hypothetical protein
MQESSSSHSREKSIDEVAHATANGTVYCSMDLTLIPALVRVVPDGVQRGKFAAPASDVVTVLLLQQDPAT